MLKNIKKKIFFSLNNLFFKEKYLTLCKILNKHQKSNELWQE